MSRGWPNAEVYPWQRIAERQKRTVPPVVLCVVCVLPKPATIRCAAHGLVPCCDEHYRIHRRIAHQPKNGAQQVLGMQKQ